MMNDPVLKAPNFDKPFKIMVDASDIAAGAVLMQEDSDKVDHPVVYFSRKFSPCQRNYSTVEKECLALIWAIQIFQVYFGSNLVTVYTDHNPLVFINKSKGTNQRVLRWNFYLQQFNVNIQHISGKENILADALSRP